MNAVARDHVVRIDTNARTEIHNSGSREPCRLWTRLDISERSRPRRQFSAVISVASAVSTLTILIVSLSCSLFHDDRRQGFRGSSRAGRF